MRVRRTEYRWTVLSLFPQNGERGCGRGLELAREKFTALVEPHNHFGCILNPQTILLQLSQDGQYFILFLKVVGKTGSIFASSFFDSAVNCRVVRSPVRREAA
jgi:hypothetical protein